ncbi:hypothetical protein [Serratia fonticola]|uniref:hypothetical protein n=1 Tax=Serratia fonticola TaxID=47917 RepID=UPI0034C5FCF5
MLHLTIEGLKSALTYIQDNSKTIAFHGKTKADGKPNPNHGLIIAPEHMSEDEQYHLRVIQALTPKLITRLNEDYTVLSLDGQELLHVLSDDAYLANLSAQITNQGYSTAADVQVFKLLREKMSSDENKTWADVLRTLLGNAMNGRAPERLVVDADPAPLPVEQVESIEEVSADPEPQAAKLIKAAKQNARQSAEA